MAGAQAVAGTAAVAPEARRDEEQPLPPAGLGCAAHREPGQQSEFGSRYGRRARSTRGRAAAGKRGGTGCEGLGRGRWSCWFRRSQRGHGAAAQSVASSFQGLLTGAKDDGENNSPEEQSSFQASCNTSLIASLESRLGLSRVPLRWRAPGGRVGLNHTLSSPETSSRSYRTTAFLAKGASSVSISSVIDFVNAFIGKKFLYCEPHKRIKEVLEEELYIKRDECHIKNPAAVALEGIWSIKRNLPVGGLKPGLPNRNSLLPQPKYYSRHGGLRSKPLIPLTSTEAPEGTLLFTNQWYMLCLKISIKIQPSFDLFLELLLVLPYYVIMELK
ncbi:uncharacterized protein C11orf97 homolog [Aotus nancymaae]|uniref:uncharacterized protein C11orf97 homolog n=1 Tax=Aotus nancymaae TaxID=37293 RepID=UPI0030FEF064